MCKSLDDRDAANKAIGLGYPCANITHRRTLISLHSQDRKSLTTCNVDAKPRDANDKTAILNDQLASAWLAVCTVDQSSSLSFGGQRSDQEFGSRDTVAVRTFSKSTGKPIAFSEGVQSVLAGLGRLADALLKFALLHLMRCK